MLHQPPYSLFALVVAMVGFVAACGSSDPEPQKGPNVEPSQSVHTQMPVCADGDVVCYYPTDQDPHDATAYMCCCNSTGDCQVTMY
jgi:hypothetical protein